MTHNSVKRSTIVSTYLFPASLVGIDVFPPSTSIRTISPVAEVGIGFGIGASRVVVLLTNREGGELNLYIALDSYQ